MSVAIPLPNQDEAKLFDTIADALVEQGVVVLPHFISDALATGLLQEIKSYQDNDFKRAAIGRSKDEHKNRFVRNDTIRWLNNEKPHQAVFLATMERLREALNRRLFMGLFDYECHFAHYPPGHFYKKHVDAFRGRTNRILSTVCYLNPDWRDEEQGHLVMYDPDNDTERMRVCPSFGSMIIFLSERFPHEVLPAKRDRFSIAGWFRVNASINGLVDPPK